MTEVVKILPHGPCGNLVEVVGRNCVIDCIDEDGSTFLGRRTVAFTELEPVNGNPHHPNGPSRLKQRDACPGSRWMEAGQPDESTVDSREGTMLHDAVFNKNIRKGLSTEQQDLVESCDRGLARFPVDEWLVERRIMIQDFDANPFDPPMLLFGTADAIGRLDEDTMVIAEFKFGQIAVDSPEKNLQVAAEALGVFQEFKCKKVIVILIQPRVRMDNHPTYEFTQPEALMERIAGICNRTDQDSLELASGSHCRYCRAKRMCPVLARTETELEVGRHGLINPNNAAKVYRDANMVIKKCEDLKRDVRKVVLSQVDVEGFIVIDKKGARTITNVQAAYDSVAHLMDVAEFMSCCNVSVAQLEEMFAAKAKASKLCKTKKEAKDLFLGKVEVEYGQSKQEVRAK